jgi:hypothetical protein
MLVLAREEWEWTTEGYDSAIYVVSSANDPTGWRRGSRLLFAAVSGCTDQGKGIQARRDQEPFITTGCDGNLPVLHRRVERISDLTAQGMALIQEKHIALLKHRQNARQVASFLDG